MISRDCIITVNGNTATIDSDIYLYKYDKNIQLSFTITNSKYMYDNDDSNNLIKSMQAAYAQAKFKKNDSSDIEIEFDIQATNKGAVLLTINEELTDEDTELGEYTIQIRLLDANKNSVVTLPPVESCIHILAPLFEKMGANTNEVNKAVVNKAVARYAAPLSATTEDGTFNSKTWVDGDTITTAELNRMETGIKTNSTQYKDIANLFSTEQTANSYKIKCGNKVIAEIPLGSTTPKYTITNTLSHAINNNNTTEIEENQSYTATITASEGYSINSVVITMGGADITNNVYNEGNINIPKVTGNLVINVSAIIIPKDFIKDGLLFNLELRNRTSENNSATPPTIVDTINNKECVTHNIDWDGKTSGFVDNGLLLKDPSTIESANSFKEQTYSTLEIPKFDDTYDFSNGFTIEFTLSGHKGRGIARSYGTANGVYGVSLFHIARHLAEYFNEYIDTENKFQHSQLTFQMPTSDIVYNEDEHTYSISVDNNLNASSYLDGQLIDTINTATVSNFKKLFFPEVIKVSSLFVGFLYQNTDSRNFILSEMRLYNKVLSGDEIYSNYNKTLSLQTLSNFQ